ncbi:MAG: DUF503 domain-containing protein [Phycisphaerales bacterium JB065]
MHLGALQIELIIRASESLKDKRRVVKSVKDRLHREHLISVAEVGTQDHLQVATLGVAVASEGAQRCAAVLDTVISKLSDRAARPGAGELSYEIGSLTRRVLALDELPATDPEAGHAEVDAEMLRYAQSKDLMR